MNTEERVRYQLGATRPAWQHPQQVFEVSIQLFKNLKNRSSYTVHKKFKCSWDNLPSFIAEYIDFQPVKVQTFWIIGITRVRPYDSWFRIFDQEKH